MLFVFITQFIATGNLTACHLDRFYSYPVISLARGPTPQHLHFLHILKKIYTNQIS